MHNCAEYGLDDLRVNVDKEFVDVLRSRLPPRDEVLAFVSPEFDEAAKMTYKHIGSPNYCFAEGAQMGWSIFAQMTPILQSMFAA